MIRVKQVSDEAYEGLTIRQRLGAAIAAMGRGDDAEVKRLVQTQRKGVPLGDTLALLEGFALAHECDVREQLIGFHAMFLRNDELAEIALQNVADYEAGWRIAMDELGIDLEDWEKAAPPRSEFWDIIAPMLPEPDLDNSKAYAERYIIPGIKGQTSDQRSQKRGAVC